MMEGNLVTREDLTQVTGLLLEVVDIAKDNNRILRRMQFWGRIAFWAKVVIWTIVLILPFFLIPLLAPYFTFLPSASSTGTSTVLFGMPTPGAVQAAMQRY